MARDRVDFLAVNQDLHALDGREVGGDRVDDRVDGEQLGQRATRMGAEMPLRSTKASPLSVT